jgi:predicted HicB family RNase H-like nuclease
MPRRTQPQGNPTADRVQMIVRVPPELHLALRHAALDRRTSLNEMLLKALQEWWREQPEHGRY